MLRGRRRRRFKIGQEPLVASSSLPPVTGFRFVRSFCSAAQIEKEKTRRIRERPCAVTDSLRSLKEIQHTHTHYTVYVTMVVVAYDCRVRPYTPSLPNVIIANYVIILLIITQVSKVYSYPLDICPTLHLLILWLMICSFPNSIFHRI